MNEDRLDVLIKDFERGREGDGYWVEVSLVTGKTLRGSIMRPSDGILPMITREENNNPVNVVIENIVTLQFISPP